MRGARVTTRPIFAALLATALSGCFVNEIDKAVAAAPGSGKVPSQVEQPATPAAGAAPKQAANGKPAAPSGPGWWQTATSLGSEESKTDIVGCKLARGVEFMARDDCLARGGAAQ